MLKFVLFSSKYSPAEALLLMVCSLWDASSSTLSQGWFLLFLQGTAMFCSFFIPGSCLLSLLLAVTISVFPCFWRFQQLTSTGYEVCRLFYSCICLMFFSWLDLRHIFLEGHLGKITTYYSQHDILLSMLTFITWGGVFQIVHCKMTVFSPLSILHSLEGINYLQSTLKEWEVMSSPLWKVEYLHKLFWNFSAWGVYLFFHLYLNHLATSVWTDIYFIF